jgi:hypothetical protein
LLPGKIYQARVDAGFFVSWHPFLPFPILLVRKDYLSTASEADNHLVPDSSASRSRCCNDDAGMQVGLR